MGWYEDAVQQVINVSRHAETKAENVALYQERYKGKGQSGWKQHIIHDLLGMRDITVGSVGKEEYTRLAHNMARRFDSGKKAKNNRGINAPEPKNKQEYKNLGASQPPIAPPRGGYHVHYEGGIFFSGCKPVVIDIDITGELAEELFKDPSRLEHIMMEVWLEQEGEEDVNGTCDLEGEDAEENVLTVTANPDDFTPKPRKRHKSSVPFLKRKR